MLDAFSQQGLPFAIQGGTWSVLSQNKSLNQGCWNRQRFLDHSGRAVGATLLKVREGSLEAVGL